MVRIAISQAAFDAIAKTLPLGSVSTNVVAGACFAAAGLPAPEPSERKPPASDIEDGGLLALMGAEDGDELEHEDQDD
jgi:hypothetical protein